MYQKLAMLIGARITCRDRCVEAAKNNAPIETWKNHQKWFNSHSYAIDELMKTAPSGAGIDCGTKIDLDRSTSEKLVFSLSYHHMNDAGYYDGWTEHTLIVRPSLQFGISLTISGRDRNEIKDYLHEVYHEWLKSEASE